MKNSRIFLCCSLLISNLIHGQITGNGPSLSHGSSMNGPPVTPRDVSPYANIVNINGQDGFYIHRDLYLNGYYTIIDGQKVLGIPFLFAEWSEGTISTPDGRLYTDYKLKYNAQNQTVFFLNGSDSLEVNEEIKEFTLKKSLKDSTITSRFVHSSEYQKSNKPFYYEVLLDNERGQLLKINSKVVSTTDNNIIGGKTTKYLNLESSYFYFDKKAKKMTKIKADSDMRSILHLSPEEGNDLNVESFDTSDESNLIKLVKMYFEKTKLKGY